MAQISALIAYDNETGKILWSEGCDPDGYSDHQVIVPRSYLTENDVKKMYSAKQKQWADGEGSEYFNLGDMEANHSCERYELFTVRIKNIDIPDNFNDL